MKKKKEHQFKDKVDRLRLAMGWGRGKRVIQAKPKPAIPCPAGIKLQDMVLDFYPKPVINKNPFHDGFSFGAKLEKRGFTKLGAGCFSTVYAKEGSNRVIKVTTRLDNWIDYIHWASQKGYCGTYAPKVFSYKKIKGTSGAEFAVSVVERMERPMTDVQRHDDEYIITSLLYPAMYGNQMAQVYLEDFSPGLPKFLLDFHSHWGRSHTDLYGNNMMLRKDGSFCVTDPLAGQSALKINRLRSKDFTSLAPAIRIFYETISCRTY